MSLDPQQPTQVQQDDIERQRMGSHEPATGQDRGNPQTEAAQEVPVDPRGMWQVILGAAVAVLAPLAGFLGGTIAGPTGSGQIDTVLAWLISGIFVGGGGALVALIGGLRWHRHLRAHQVSRASAE